MTLAVMAKDFDSKQFGVGLLLGLVVRTIHMWGIWKIGIWGRSCFVKLQFWFKLLCEIRNLGFVTGA